MTDTVSQMQRSWNMSRIKGKDTKPELYLRSLLHKDGFRFRIHDGRLPGKPDIVLPRYKTAIFVNGCFWHRHKGCKYAYKPKSRRDFWQEKFRKTVLRDQKKIKELEQLGWKVIVVWECELKKDSEQILDRLTSDIKECG